MSYLDKIKEMGDKLKHAVNVEEVMDKVKSVTGLGKADSSESHKKQEADTQAKESNIKQDQLKTEPKQPDQPQKPNASVSDVPPPPKEVPPEPNEVPPEPKEVPLEPKEIPPEPPIEHEPKPEESPEHKDEDDGR